MGIKQPLTPAGGAKAPCPSPAPGALQVAQEGVSKCQMPSPPWQGLTLQAPCSFLALSVTPKPLLLLPPLAGSLHHTQPFFGGFPCDSDGKESACNAGDPSSITGSGPWSRAWQPTPVFLPGESHGQRSLCRLQSTRWQRVGLTLSHFQPLCLPRQYPIPALV